MTASIPTAKLHGAAVSSCDCQKCEALRAAFVALRGCHAQVTDDVRRILHTDGPESGVRALAYLAFNVIAELCQHIPEDLVVDLVSDALEVGQDATKEPALTSGAMH